MTDKQPDAEAIAVAKEICRQVHIEKFGGADVPPWRPGELDSRVEQHWREWLPAAASVIDAIGAHHAQERRDHFRAVAEYADWQLATVTKERDEARELWQDTLANMYEQGDQLAAREAEVGRLKDLLALMSGYLADEGDDLSEIGLANRRRGVANALGEDCPDWLRQYQGRAALAASVAEKEEG